LISAASTGMMEDIDGGGDMNGWLLEYKWAPDVLGRPLLVRCSAAGATSRSAPKSGQRVSIG